MIVLIRHATPVVPMASCGYDEACRRLDQYNTTETLRLDEIDRKTEMLTTLGNDSNVKFYISPLPRALITARAMFADRITEARVAEDFQEFNLKIAYLPWVKLRLEQWFAVSRLLWVLGLNRSEHTFKSEKERAKRVARTLLASHKGNTVVLVAHGLLNRYVAKHLTRNGMFRQKRSSCGSFTIDIFKTR